MSKSRMRGKVEATVLPRLPRKEAWPCPPRKEEWAFAHQDNERGAPDSM